MVCSRQTFLITLKSKAMLHEHVNHVLRQVPACFPQLEEKLVQNSEQQLADLRRRSTSIAPLRLRRTNQNRPITVESLCDWEGAKVMPLPLLEPQTWSRSVGAAQSNLSYRPGFSVQRREVDPEIHLRC